MSAGERALAAARAVVGAPFRPQGRDPALGLDCVGLAGLALRAGGCAVRVPDGYPLRGGDPAGIARRIEAAGLVAAAETVPGDLLMFRTGPGQLHLAIASGKGIIHADAMLRRVVERPGPAPWPLIGRWRPAEGEE